MGGEVGDGTGDSLGCGMPSGLCWVPSSGKPLNGCGSLGSCLGIWGQGNGRSFISHLGLTCFLSALALCTWGVYQPWGKSLGASFAASPVFPPRVWAPGLCLHQKVIFMLRLSSPGAPCPAWNPAPAVSPSSALPPPPPLASPRAAPWSPDSQD